MVNAGRVLIIPKGDYNPSEPYSMLDLVTYEGSSYVAKQATQGNLPTNTTYWQMTAKGSNIVNALKNFAPLETTDTATHPYVIGDLLVGKDENLKKVTAPISPGNTITDGVNVENATVAEIVQAIESSIAAINTSMDSLSTEVEGLGSSVDTLTTQFEGLDSDVDSLSTQLESTSSTVNTLSTQMGKTYKSDDSTETEIVDADYIPFYDSSANAMKRILVADANFGGSGGSIIKVTAFDTRLLNRPVTVTDGTTTLTGTISSSGLCTFENVSLTGSLTISAMTADNLTVTEKIYINYYGLYEVALQFPSSTGIYGISWDGGASPAMIRTDDSTFFVDPSPAVNNGNGSSPFDNILPWSGMVIEEDTNGGTLVKIPKYYYRWSKSGTTMALQISATPQTGFSVSPAHADRGDNHGERDFVYVGRYHCAPDYKSKTGVIPPGLLKKAESRTSIHGLGSDIWQYDFAMYWTIMMLYLVEYANWNSQATIGYGGANSKNGAEATGFTDNMYYHTGTNAVNRTTYGHVQYRHIEDLWANLLDICDGIYFKNSKIYIINTPSDFSDNSGGTDIGTKFGGTYKCVKAWNIPSVSGFEWALFPSEIVDDDSYSTYVCDEYGAGNSSFVELSIGASFYCHPAHGAFCFRGAYSNQLDYERGARIQKLPS